MDLFTVAGTITIDASEANATLDALIEKAGQLAETLNGGTKVTVTAGTTTTGTQTTKPTTTTTTPTGSSGSKATTTTDTKGNTWQNAWSVALGNIATDVARKVYAFGKDALHTGYSMNSNWEMWHNKIKSIMNYDDDQTTAMMNELWQFAVDTPYSMPEVMNQAVMLLGNRNVRENTDIIDLMTMIGNMANGDNAAFGSLAKGVMQVFAKGKVQAEEVNQQFAERGVDVYQMIADYFNVSGRDGKTDWDAKAVMGLAQVNPEIMPTADEFYQAMRYANFDEDGEYYGRMQAMMDTTHGKALKLKDEAERTSAALTKGVFKVFSEETLPAVSESLSNLYEWAENNEDTLSEAAQVASDLVTGAVDTVTSAIPGILEFVNAGGVEGVEMLAGMGMLAKGFVTGGVKDYIFGGALVAHATASSLSKMLDMMSEQGIDSLETGLEMAQRNLDNQSTIFNYLFKTGAYKDMDYTSPVEEWLNRGMESIPGEGNTRSMLGPGKYYESPYTIIDGKLVLTNPGALTDEEDNGYIREANPWEQFMVGFADLFFGDDAKLLYEKHIGLREDDRPFDELTVLEKGKAELELLMAGLFGSPEELEAIQRKYGFNDDETDDEGSADQTGGSRRYPGESDAFLLMTGHPERIVPDDDSDGTSGSVGIPALVASIQSLTSAVQGMTGEIPLAITTGISGISVTGTVTTGDVMLNTGALVGQLAPRLDLRLGAANERANRG